MYKFGVAHCCCGDCVILNFDNCKSETDFNRAFEHESGSEPSFSGTVNNYVGERATFSSNAKYLVNPKLKESVGAFINPQGTISSVTYFFDQYAKQTDTLITTWKVVYTVNNGTTSGSKPFKVEIYKGNSKVYETEDLICEFANELPDNYLGTFNFKTWLIKNKDTNKIEFWGQLSGSPGTTYGGDYFFYNETLTTQVYYKLHWEIVGTNWYLEPGGTNGYITLWEPDKDEPENCEYPDDCSYLIGNLEQNYPRLRVWFTGFTDHQYQGYNGIYDCGNYPPDALSKLNDLYCYGRSKQRCTIRFSTTRWVAGELETNPNYDSSKLTDSSASETDVCTQRTDGSPVLLIPEYLRFSQNQTYDDKIDLTLGVYIYRYEQRAPYSYSYGSNAYSATFRGTAYKNSDGQLDLTRLSEVTLVKGTADTGHPDIAGAAFNNVICHIGQHRTPLSNIRNKAILGTQSLQNTGEIDYITVTCQIGFIGFTTATRFPTTDQDFVQYYPTVTAILSPQDSRYYDNGSAWSNNPACYLPPLMWRSPKIALSTLYDHYVQFELYLHTGEMFVYGNSILTTEQYPGSAVISPRGASGLSMRNCIDIANDTYTPQGVGQGEVGIPETSGKFLNNIDEYGNMTIMCRHPFDGNGLQNWNMVMGQGFPGRAYFPDAYCSPPTDPDTGFPVYYYGGIPAMKGTIQITYRQ